jgi:phenylacetate-CoA ligase
LIHARSQVPFYAERLRAAGIDPERELTESGWARLPILQRRDVQSLGDGLNARSIPPSHGGVASSTSGGSSGVPVRVQKTALANFFWSAIQVREEIWHRENPLGVIARIRRVPGYFTEEQAARVRSAGGLMLPDWGPPITLLHDTGPLGVLDDRVSIPEQAAFLRRLAPDYLFTFPANLRLLLAHLRESGAKLGSLRSVWTMSEVVDASLRDLCREVLGCRIVHNYTSAEGGYLALQCPSFDHFHVQSEVVFLEVLDANGHPCEPGEVGRVVITPLHNFATPLLRYEIGDEAEVGEACPCGRGLPVLRRIVGRTYDYVTLPSGARRRVDTGYYEICKIPAVREFQLVQRALDRIELLVVLARPLAESEKARIEAVLRAEFGSDFHFEISERDAIPRTEAGKLRAFVSELGAGRDALTD